MYPLAFAAAMVMLTHSKHEPVHQPAAQHSHTAALGPILAHQLHFSLLLFYCSRETLCKPLAAPFPLGIYLPVS